jgi:hypothetical protein
VVLQVNRSDGRRSPAYSFCHVMTRSCNFTYIVSHAMKKDKDESRC